ncbi:MAG: tetratricopeptide repeat protein [Cyclobacteriaceae bacterium]|nr:tetratricopeptide repeat protein [Cyclobacteriaceae bacterium]
MLRTRYILVLVGIAISTILYLFPKVVVDNKEEQVDVAQQETTEEEDHSDHEAEDNSFNHTSSIPPPTLEKINNLRELFKINISNEKSATFADSLASIFYSAGKLDSVVKYRQWLADNFPNEENIEIAGLAYYEAFGYAINDEKAKLYGDKVQKYLGDLFEKHPDRLDLKSKIAMTYISSQNPMQGIMMLREVVSADPENEEALYNLGLLSRQSGQMEKAVERFEKILSINPNHIQARFLLGVTFKEMGRNKEAREQLEIVKRTDDDPTVLATVNSYLEEIK